MQLPAYLIGADNTFVSIGMFRFKPGEEGRPKIKIDRSKLLTISTIFPLASRAGRGSLEDNIRSECVRSVMKRRGTVLLFNFFNQDFRGEAGKSARGGKYKRLGS